VDLPVCDHAHLSPCYDMLHLTVIEQVVHRPQKVHVLCGGDESTKACAVIDTAKMTCTIYLPPHVHHDHDVYVHELNHCHGWEHDPVKGYSLPSHSEPRAHKRPWHPFDFVPESWYPPSKSYAASDD
jgi:hypothetical protein